VHKRERREEEEEKEIKRSTSIPSSSENAPLSM
jgi:hypothetical protein